MGEIYCHLKYNQYIKIIMCVCVCVYVWITEVGSSGDRTTVVTSDLRTYYILRVCD